MLAKSLKKGETIGIVATSKPFNKEKEFELDNFIKYMDEQGLKVKLSDNFYASDKYEVSAGAPQERADDINNMFSDKNISAIWGYQGGETANQTLDLIDYNTVKKNPKIFLGKSDIDILLLALNKKTGLITINTCDPKIGSDKELDFEYTKTWFKKRLFERSKEIKPSKPWHTINGGEAEGKIIGCNITTIVKMAGTDYFPDFTNAIFFIESVNLDPTAVIWQMTHLKMLGVFDQINGVVIGNNYGWQSDQFTFEGIVKDLLSEYDLPILKINEFGHYQPHAFLPIGAKIKLDATNKTISIINDFLI